MRWAPMGCDVDRVLARDALESRTRARRPACRGQHSLLRPTRITSDPGTSFGPPVQLVDAAQARVRDRRPRVRRLRWRDADPRRPSRGRRDSRDLGSPRPSDRASATARPRTTSAGGPDGAGIALIQIWAGLASSGQLHDARCRFVRWLQSPVGSTGDAGNHARPGSLTASMKPRLFYLCALYADPLPRAPQPPSHDSD